VVARFLFGAGSGELRYDLARGTHAGLERGIRRRNPIARRVARRLYDSHGFASTMRRKPHITPIARFTAPLIDGLRG